MRKMKKKYINLYSRYLKNKNEVVRKKHASRKQYIICSVAAVLIIPGIFIIMKLKLKSLDTKKNDLNNQLYSSGAMQRETDKKVLEKKTEIMGKIIISHEENKNGLVKTQEISDKLKPELMNEILNCQIPELVISEISFNGENIYISCVVNQANQASDFITNIEGKKLFSNIQYGGFNWSGSGYSFMITATL